VNFDQITILYQYTCTENESKRDEGTTIFLVYRCNIILITFDFVWRYDSVLGLNPNSIRGGKVAGKGKTYVVRL